MKFKHLPLLGLALGLGVSATNAGERRHVGDGLPKFLEQFDVNGDGVIDEEERQAIKDAHRQNHEDRINKWDTDGDGSLSDEEKEAARAAIAARIEERRTERFNQIAGEDGCISPEEFNGIPTFEGADPGRMRRLFDHLDTDGSGDIKLDEFLAHLRPPRHDGHRPHRPHRPDRPTDDGGGDDGGGDDGGGDEGGGDGA